MGKQLFFGMIGLLIIQRLTELRLAKQNEQKARAAGAKEYGAEHYPLFFVLHIGWFVGWISEAIIRGIHPTRLWPLWFCFFSVAQLLRYWAITTLGSAWNTRVLIIPNQPRIQGGPYRFMDHPNYLAVIIELAMVPLMFRAWITTTIASIFNAILLLGIRIPAEERALEKLD